MGVPHLRAHGFKGPSGAARRLALALESRGGSLDAYTSRDTTAFHARVLDADLPRALDVLTDLVRHPILRESDLELERNVVLEEINVVEDTPDDQVFDLSSGLLWPSHPYGYSILGTRESVSSLSTTDLKLLHEQAYFPGNCVIAAAGTSSARLWKAGPRACSPSSRASSRAADGRALSTSARGAAAAPYRCAQTPSCLPRRRRYAIPPLAVLCLRTFCASCRALFQRIREELGRVRGSLQLAGPRRGVWG